MELDTIYQDKAHMSAQKALSLGADGAEAYISSSKRLEIEVRNQAVETMKLAEDRGLGMRVFVGERTGFAFTTELSDTALEETIRQALANAALAEPDPQRQLPHPAQEYPRLDLYDHQIKQNNVEHKITMAKQMEQRALSKDDRINVIESSTYQDGEVEVIIANTHGLAQQYRGAYCGLYLSLVAGSGEGSQTGFAMEYSLRFGDLNPDQLGDLAADRALRMLGAQRGATAQAPVVLEPYVAAGFLGVLAPALSAEAVQKGRSLFAGQVGQKIASDLLHIIDDGTLDGGLGSAPFDGEGVPTTKTVLMERGTLQGYLHNTYTAAKDGVTSTGNGTRGSFKGTPEVGTTNFFISPGLVTPVEIIADINQGLYVTEVMGLHTANPISGDFSFGVSGIWIENGVLTRPVRGMAVAGNITDVIKNINAVGDDLKFFGSTGAPTIGIAQMSISGQ